MIIKEKASPKSAVMKEKWPWTSVSSREKNTPKGT